jgi:hypothetical protein
MPLLITLNIFRTNCDKIDEIIEYNIPLKFQKGLQKGPLGWAEWLLLSYVHPTMGFLHLT